MLNLKKGDIMYDFLSSFFLGIFSTAFLFLLSVVLSLGAKAVYFHVKDIAEVIPKPRRTKLYDHIGKDGRHHQEHNVSQNEIG